jgi:threonine dehydratase
MFDLAELERAHEVVRQAVPPTPAYAWPLLAQRLGTSVVVKHENHTPTGAFKVRGGLTYVDAVKREQPDVTGLISATRGNHGQSIAFAGRRHGLPVTIYVPRGNSVEKNRAMTAFGAGWSSTATTSRRRARRPIAMPRAKACTSCRRFIVISRSALPPMR